MHIKHMGLLMDDSVLNILSNQDITLHVSLSVNWNRCLVDIEFY